MINEYKNAEVWQIERKFIEQSVAEEQMTVAHFLGIIFFLVAFLVMLFTVGVVG